MARVGGWADTPGKPRKVEVGIAKSQLHLPSCWNWLSEGWTGGPAHWKIMPGSCPSPEQGMGAQDPRYIALSLEVPSNIPGLVCLELAPNFCTPAVPPAPSWGLSPP